jgi:hypothetical protein
LHEVNGAAFRDVASGVFGKKEMHIGFDTIHRRTSNLDTSLWHYSLQVTRRFGKKKMEAT